MGTYDLRELPFNGLYVKNRAMLVVKIMLIIKLIRLLAFPIDITFDLRIEWS